MNDTEAPLSDNELAVLLNQIRAGIDQRPASADELEDTNPAMFDDLERGR